MTTRKTLTLDDIANALYGAGLPAPLGERVVVDCVIDSRTAARGSLFFALRGERTDGHLYVYAAFERGAVAAVAQEGALELAPGTLAVSPQGKLFSAGSADAPSGEALRPPVVFLTRDSLAALQTLGARWRAALPVETVGITGSIGKSTTKETVANVLATRYVTLRSEGNLNNEIGLPLTLLRLRGNHERAVLEMGMYAVGEITQLVGWARPRIGVVTNVGPVHLERLGSIERIAEAKSELPRGLPPAEDGGVAILNRDDPLVWSMAGTTRARVFSYGLNPQADLWADEIESGGLEGIKFWLHHGKERYHAHLPLLGRHSVHTALRSAAVGLMAGLSWDEIMRGLQDARGQLRLMVVPGLRDTTIIDDTYNASPDSTLAALNLLRDIANSSHRAVAVLGDMFELGSYEEAGHRLVGGRAAQVVDKLVTVGPRARWIAEEALASGMSPTNVHPVAGNTDAIGILQGMIRPGDIVLVKGSRAAAMESIVDALSREGGRGAGAKQA
ncbi:MAG: UDP-N-acetylmuramoyl-tripeptide--D-alanyl-D-alanine ligase [Anaerolineae bacterium]|nr:UDP-N-acetylmuramoyl-tripeptide--D-alanyl-D-alanine ligase [Anaerolineae bacterium]